MGDTFKKGGLSRGAPLRSSGSLQRKTPLSSGKPKDGEPAKQGKDLQRKTPLKSKGTPLKQGKPLETRKPLRAKKPLAQGKPLENRTGLASGKPLESRTGLKRTAPPKTGSPLPRGSLDSKTSKPLPRAPMKAKRAEVTPEERACRKIVSERSGGLCEKCGLPRGLEKAHRIGRGVGGRWTPANILDLCHDCHHGHHGSPAEAYAGGWHLRSTQNPLTEKVLIMKEGRYDWALLDDEGGWRWVEQS